MSSAPAHGATTPQLIKQGMYASAACALLALLAVTSGARSHRQAMQTIGRDAAPSIIAAQHISAAMADMDANAVNALLFGKEDLAKASEQAVENRRREASEVLIAAAENITYGDAERIPIHTLAIGLSSYTAEIQRALDLRRAGDPSYIDAYRAAAKRMDESLLPAAADLDRANRSVFDRTYIDQHARASGAMVFLILSTLALVGMLIALQVFLTRRMRRIVNPLLLVSTGVAFLAFVFSAESFTRADQQLKIAREDAFESVHTLWKARGVAYSANADESRYLLDPARAARYEQAFLQKINSIDKTAPPFDNYLAIDHQIRALERSGQHAAAIRLCTGESDLVFNKFDQAIEESLQTKQAAFDQAVKSGFDAVDHLEVLAVIIYAAIALLAMLGLLPRLREYSAA